MEIYTIRGINYNPSYDNPDFKKEEILFLTEENIGDFSVSLTSDEDNCFLSSESSIHIVKLDDLTALITTMLVNL